MSESVSQQTLLSTLKRVFGYDAFRPGQEDVVRALLDGRDALAVMPTGAGKSICFQLPALLLSGVTLVISPLISLMKDQVQSLVENGVRAAYLNTSLTHKQVELVLNRMARGVYKIIYVAPERLTLPAFQRAVAQLNVSLLVVDEAHCVSQWGHDFRPCYLEIAPFCASLRQRPTVCACTATATRRVRDDIIELLCLNEPRLVTRSFDRQNLFFEVERPKQKFLALRRRLDICEGRSGIVYCSSRKKVDELCETLTALGYSVTGYHAGMDQKTRRQNQDDFLYDRKRIMVATNAFGMGIDKPNVSFVIHFSIPGDMESYYQEAGRAGRDGSAADCVLLFQKKDLQIQRYFIDNPEENEALSKKEAAQLRRQRHEKLDRMIDYAEHTGCLRQFILDYFGEEAPDNCGNCSGCLGNRLSIDVTVNAQKILSCVVRLKADARPQTVAAVLKGREEAAAAFGSNSTFGLMADMAQSEIERLIAFLCERELLMLRDGVLTVTDDAKDVLYRGRHVRMAVAKEGGSRRQKKDSADLAGGITDPVLYSRLRALRKTLADKASMPAFTIFTDKTLQAMAALQPRTLRDFSKLPGVGSHKLEKYGIVFLKEILAYLKETNTNS